MKISKIIFGFFVNLFYCMQCFSSKDISEIKEFGNNPGNLKMFLHTLKETDTSKAHPLVVVLHGCTQRARRISLETGWNKIADNFGFRVIYAQQKPSNNPNRCFNWYQKTDNTKDNGEVASIKSMIDFMIKNYNTDTSKIFIYGVSAGAAMSTAMMACYPGLFKAGCIVAGGPYIKGVELSEARDAMKNPVHLTPEEWGDFVKVQNPDYTGKYPKLIVIHGANDKVVNIENAVSLINQWTNIHKIDTIPDKDDDFPKYANIERMVYKNEEEEAVITFYKFLKLGHQLPICPGTKVNEGGQLDLFAVKADFHSTCQVAVDFGLIK